MKCPPRLPHWVGQGDEGRHPWHLPGGGLAFSPILGTQVWICERHTLSPQTTDSPYCLLSETRNPVIRNPAAYGARALTPVSRAANHKAPFQAGSCFRNSTHIALLNFTVNTTSAHGTCILVSTLSENITCLRPHS